MLAHEDQCRHGTTSHEHQWEVMADLCFYRDPKETEKEEQATAEKSVTEKEFHGEWTPLVPECTAPQFKVAG